jgi:hypothetical protein
MCDETKLIYDVIKDKFDNGYMIDVGRLAVELVESLFY